ncbi:hypothetical protein GGTG_11816 [Gaeumannomyces tritici R3-111a-1]|uniref:Uncharacterized protein n=1 Tax=Gaeumannomyces tritici (strain R3-111a-1) TaxID=644352 RepID=J3PE93_GAET3|nr:hypothetical protein GGTG_11816 [Gaeumannomyces tritici R3-111a-1]EJT70793.1 hypothetical protein GGTG_11816 [Gaeumannomyces tritici R3-111a-1]
MSDFAMENENMNLLKGTTFTTRLSEWTADNEQKVNQRRAEAKRYLRIGYRRIEGFFPLDNRFPALEPRKWRGEQSDFQKARGRQRLPGEVVAAEERWDKGVSINGGGGRWLYPTMVRRKRAKKRQSCSDPFMVRIWVIKGFVMVEGRQTGTTPVRNKDVVPARRARLRGTLPSSLRERRRWTSENQDNGGQATRCGSGRPRIVWRQCKVECEGEICARQRAFSFQSPASKAKRGGMLRT